MGKGKDKNQRRQRKKTDAEKQAMQRPCVPIKHEAKKRYYVALQNAFFDWERIR